MSIRLRLALVFALASALLLSVGGWFFVSTLSTSLMSSIDSQLSVQASHGSSYLTSNPSIPTTPAGTNAPEYAVQVIDQVNQVRGASAEAGHQPLLSPSLLSEARTQAILVNITHDGESERVLAQPYPGQSGWLVIAAVSLESFNATISRVTTQLAVGCSLVVLLAAIGAYFLSRSALKPVERLRREVASLSERPVAEAVGVPKTHDEIAALATTMNELLMRLGRSHERERGLIADVSHELRTPFAVLRGELELAQRPGRNHEELVAAVTAAAEEAARLNRIADDLLLLTRGDQDQLPMHFEVTNVHRLLAGMAHHAESRLHAAGISCRVDAPTDLLAKVDGDRIRQAIDNLIENASRFSPGGAEITLAARSLGEDLELEVADRGPGFPPDFLPHAFERFRRPDSSRSRIDGGAGLGLAIVMTIAVAHGGMATVVNRPEGGASVRLLLPKSIVDA
jgi:two-component system, OmpR family, sensor kinase